MIGFTFQGPDKPAELQEIPTPEPGPGEILLRMGANTVCGTVRSHPSCPAPRSRFDSQTG